MDRKNQILEFASKHTLCVVSTCVGDQPESALVDFVMTADFEIIFNTYTTSRKYKNLKLNPKVSIVIGFGDSLKTLQCEGWAQELEGHAEGKVMSDYKDHLGFFRRWKIKDMRYFVVKPTWLRLSDFSEYPPKTAEVKLGLLEGKATFKIHSDFKMTDEELFRS